MYVSRPSGGCRLLPVLPPKNGRASVNDLLPDPLKSDVKWQKLIECVLTRNNKQYLGKTYTEERVNELSAE